MRALAWGLAAALSLVACKDDRAGTPAPSASDRAKEVVQTAADKAKEGLGVAGDKARELGESAEDAIDTAKDHSADALRKAIANADTRIQQVLERIERADTSDARNKAARLLDRLREYKRRLEQRLGAKTAAPAPGSAPAPAAVEAPAPAPAAP